MKELRLNGNERRCPTRGAPSVLPGTVRRDARVGSPSVGVLELSELVERVRLRRTDEGDDAAARLADLATGLRQLHRDRHGSQQGAAEGVRSRVSLQEHHHFTVNANGETTVVFEKVRASC